MTESSTIQVRRLADVDYVTLNRPEVRNAFNEHLIFEMTAWAERAAGEGSRAFFQRIDLPRVKAVLADLETMRASDAQQDDFVDLGESAEFKVEAMEGECSA